MPEWLCVVLKIAAGCAVLVPVAVGLGRWFVSGVGRRVLTPSAGHLSVTSDGTLGGTRVHDSKGREVRGITGVFFNVEKGRPVQCCVDLDSRNFFGIGQQQFQMADPLTGRMRPLQRVVWADGSEWSAGEAGKQ